MNMGCPRISIFGQPSFSVAPALALSVVLTTLSFFQAQAFESGIASPAVGAAAEQQAPPSQDPALFQVRKVFASDVRDDEGKALEIQFLRAIADSEQFQPDRERVRQYEVWRKGVDGGDAVVAKVDAAAKDIYTVVDDKLVDAGPPPYQYFVKSFLSTSDPLQVFQSEPSAPATPKVNWFNTKRTPVALIVVMVGLLFAAFLDRARKTGQKPYIRRITGVDAIEEAVGRATEMGRSVLYVPGIEDFTDMQTVASMLILGNVAEIVARYSSSIYVPNRVPFVMTVAEEVVRQGFYRAGRPDAHKPENIYFGSDEQFALVAGIAGLMMREKPAANLYFGKFYAESLLLAETGFASGAIQVAGTAETTQIPFFVAACDYCLIGEELYAASAYMSQEPRLLSTLKAADWMKVAIAVLLVVGVIENLVGSSWVSGFLAGT